MQVVLDFGSANSHKNRENTALKMIDELAKIDTKKHEVIIKHQLWHKAKPQGDNVTLDWLLFHAISKYAYREYGYKTTASVFDKESLDFLVGIDLDYELPFIKIACREDLYWLIHEVPRKYKLLVSTNGSSDIEWIDNNIEYMFCSPKYPSSKCDYTRSAGCYSANISDHTRDLKLFNEKNLGDNNIIYEMHYALEGATGLDAESGVCKTPEMLKEIL